MTRDYCSMASVFFVVIACKVGSTFLPSPQMQLIFYV